MSRIGSRFLGWLDKNHEELLELERNPNIVKPGRGDKENIIIVLTLPLWVPPIIWLFGPFLGIIVMFIILWQINKYVDRKYSKNE